MLIVDAQVHIWAASTPERPWPARHAPHRPVPFSKDDLLAEMNAAGVHRAVLVPPSWEGERNDLALAAAAAHPDRFAIMGRIDPADPASRDAIAGWRRQPGMLGLRFTFHTPQLEPLLTEGRVDWIWRAAEEAGLPLMLLANRPRLNLIADIAQRHPGLRIVIDHLATPKGVKDDAAFNDLDLLLALAKHPNIAAKASGMPYYSSDAYPWHNLWPHLRRVYDAFGPQRLFWGTDLTKLPCTYRQAVTMFTDEIPWLTAQDKDWIMGRGLCEWLGWPAPRMG